MTGAGTIDLGTKQIGFRVEPKLVMTTEGQGRATDPVGFGIPVMIEGPWGAPRIYPEMQGILDNPDAAYAKLKEMGKGLFGPNGAGLGGCDRQPARRRPTGRHGGTGRQPADRRGANGQTSLLGGQLGETIGNLLQQGLSGFGRLGPRRSPGAHRARAASAASQPRGSPALIARPRRPRPHRPSPPPPRRRARRRPQQDSQPMNEVLAAAVQSLSSLRMAGRAHRPAIPAQNRG